MEGLENKVNQALFAIVDFLLKVTRLPPLLEAFGGREAARKVLYETILETDLMTKIESIYMVEGALNSITEKFTSLWLHEGWVKSTQYKSLEKSLAKAGFIYMGREP